MSEAGKRVTSAFAGLWSRASRLSAVTDERGQGMVEYALILALVTTVAIAGLKLIPAFPVHVFSTMANAFP